MAIVGVGPLWTYFSFEGSNNVLQIKSTSVNINNWSHFSFVHTVFLLLMHLVSAKGNLIMCMLTSSRKNVRLFFWFEVSFLCVTIKKSLSFVNLTWFYITYRDVRFYSFLNHIKVYRHNWRASSDLWSTETRSSYQ